MAITVRIPTPLRKFTNEKETLSLQGKTVREVVENLVKDYPELKNQLLDSEGQVRRFVNFFLNDRDVRFLSGLDTEVKDGDELAIIPAIAGGGEKGSFPYPFFRERKF
jgi:molybdopterin synthase sulfur carrier subunit